METNASFVSQGKQRNSIFLLNINVSLLLYPLNLQHFIYI